MGSNLRIHSPAFRRHGKTRWTIRFCVLTSQAIIWLHRFSHSPPHRAITSTHHHLLPSHPQAVAIFICLEYLIYADRFLLKARGYNVRQTLLWPSHSNQTHTYDGQVMLSIFQILVSNSKLMRILRHLAAPVTDHRQPKASTGAPGIRRVARDEHESKKCASGALLPNTAPPVAIRP